MTGKWDKDVASISQKHREKSKCTRCEALIGATDYHYGCLKCIQPSSKTLVCKKCCDQDEICRIHKVELVKRYFKPWGDIPLAQNYVDSSVAKGDDELIQALKERDPERISHFAKDKKLLNAHGDFVHLGYTPLHVAAHLNLEDGARILIQHGAFLEPKDQWNMTPLLVAVQSGNVGVFKLLLDSGVSITSTSGNYASTALHVAAENGMYHLVTYILSQKVPVDIPSGRGSALQIATTFCSKKCVEILLAAGADPNAKEGLFGAPLISAARQRVSAKDLCEILLKQGAKVDIRGGHSLGGEKETDLTALSIAVRLNRRDVLELLLQYGAAIDAQDSGGLTALMRASALGRLENCRLLLDRGADTEILSGKGKGLTALLGAVMWGREDVVDLLLERGASAIPQSHIGGKWKSIEKSKTFKELSAERRVSILKKLRAAKKRERGVK